MSWQFLFFLVWVVFTVFDPFPSKHSTSSTCVCVWWKHITRNSRLNHFWAYSSIMLSIFTLLWNRPLEHSHLAQRKLYSWNKNSSFLPCHTPTSLNFCDSLLSRIFSYLGPIFFSLSLFFFFSGSFPAPLLSVIIKVFSHTVGVVNWKGLSRVW